MTLKGVNADWAKAHQCAHVRTHSRQRAQTGFTADAGILLQPFLPPSPPVVSPLLSLALIPLLSLALGIISSLLHFCALPLYTQPHFSKVAKLLHESVVAAE